MVRKMNVARAEIRAGAEAPAHPQIQQQVRWLDLAQAGAVESPARRLQLELQHSFAAPEVSRWSKRRALAFIVITSAALWTTLLLGVRALF